MSSQFKTTIEIGGVEEDVICQYEVEMAEPMTRDYPGSCTDAHVYRVVRETDGVELDVESLSAKIREELDGEALTKYYDDCVSAAEYAMEARMEDR